MGKCISSTSPPEKTTLVTEESPPISIQPQPNTSSVRFVPKTACHNATNSSQSFTHQINEIKVISVDSSHVFKRSYVKLLSECEEHHRCNLDKLYLNKLCVACNGYHTELALYSTAIENESNVINLQPFKYVLLSYLVHDKIEYYTQIRNAYPVYQIILDEWYKYTLYNSKWKRSINILKKQMAILNMSDFINLLYKLQPWMTAEALWSIIQFEKRKHPLCNGCGAAKLPENHRIVWCCHITIKIVCLMYFTVDLWIDDYFEKITSYIRRHQVGSCDWFWNLSKDFTYIQLFGNHVIKKHVINKLRHKRGKHMDEEKFIESCIKPPIIPINTFESIKIDYFHELKDGYTASGRVLSVSSVTFANEVGHINVHNL